MKKEQLIKMKKMLAILTASTIMTGCGANLEKKEDMSTKKSNSATIDGIINPTYEGYYLELKAYSNNDFDLYITKPFIYGNEYYLPEGYKMMENSNNTIGYKTVVHSEEIDSIDIKKYEPKTIKFSDEDNIQVYEDVEGYSFTENNEFCYKYNMKEKVNVLK